MHFLEVPRWRISLKMSKINGSFQKVWNIPQTKVKNMGYSLKRKLEIADIFYLFFYFFSLLMTQFRSGKVPYLSFLRDLDLKWSHIIFLWDRVLKRSHISFLGISFYLRLRKRFCFENRQIIFMVVANLYFKYTNCNFIGL